MTILQNCSYIKTHKNCTSLNPKFESSFTFVSFSLLKSCLHSWLEMFARDANPLHRISRTLRRLAALSESEQVRQRRQQQQQLQLASLTCPSLVVDAFQAAVRAFVRRYRLEPALALELRLARNAGALSLLVCLFALSGYYSIYSITPILVH